MSRKRGNVWTAPAERAYRYLLGGKVEIVAVNGEHVEAIVTVHDGQVRIVTCGPDGWTCTCPQRREECSHSIAVRRVVPVDLR